jgi:hypothetical protein
MSWLTRLIRPTPAPPVASSESASEATSAAVSLPSGTVLIDVRSRGEFDSGDLQAHMRAMTTYDECKAYRDQHHEEMAARARERGGKALAQPRRDACNGLKKGMP